MPRLKKTKNKKSFDHLLSCPVNTLLDTSKIGLWEIDLHGKTIYLNQSMELLLDRKLQEVKKYHFEDLLIKSEYQEKTQTEFPYCEYSIIRPDKKEVWIKMVATPIDDGSGNFTGVRAIVFNITDRKLYEKEIQELRLRMDETLSTHDIGIWHWDQTNGVVNFDPRISKHFNFKKKLATNSEVIKFIGKKNAVILRRYFSKIASNPESIVINLQNKNQEFYFKILGKKDGKNLFSGLLWDVTTEMKNSQTIAEKNLKLYQNARLTSLGILSSGIAHEINNPLAIITITCHILRNNLKHKVSDEVIKKLETITNNAMRINKIIKGIGQFAKESSDGPITNEKLSEILNDIKILFHERLINKSIQFVTSVIPKDLEISCDRGPMTQVLMNLVKNSIDAVDEKRPTSDRWIKVQCSLEGSDIHVSISDNGIGLSSDGKRKIFTPFYTTKEPGKGTGLGLVISRELIGPLNGTIELESGKNPTVFKMTLRKNLLKNSVKKVA